MERYKLNNAEKQEIRKTLHYNTRSLIDGSELVHPDPDEDWDDSQLAARQEYAHTVNDRAFLNH